MRWKTIFVVIFLGIIARKIWYLCILLQPWKVVYNHAPGPCHLVPPIGNGSEDIQLLPDGRALISSGMKLPGFSRNPRVMNSFGQFYVFDFNSPNDGAKVVPCKNFPSYGTKYFSPHGISILNKNGEIFVFAVNHPPEGNFEKDTIEKFKYDTNKNVIEHLKTYKGDYLRLVNDVVAVGSESFYATNWFYSRTKRMQQLKTLVAQLDWSNLVFYDNGQSKTGASSFMMANGVNISPDKKYVYVYTLGTFDVKVYERHQDGTLNLVQSKQLLTVSCDNLDVEQSTGDIWITCHAVRYYTTKYIEEPDNQRPWSPSQVFRIRTKEGLMTDDITEIYSSDGSLFGAASVAVYHKDTHSMLIGSIERDMLFCEVKTE